MSCRLRPVGVRYLVAVATCVVWGAVPATSRAVPVSTTLNVVDTGPDASFIGIDLEILGGLVTENITTFISGQFDVTLDNVGIQALSLTIDSASLALSDVMVDIDLGFLGSVQGELVGVNLSTVGVPHAQLPFSGGANSFFDLGGDTISIDSGLLTYEGVGGIAGALGSGTFDLASNPVAFELPSGATIRLVETALSPNSNGVTLIVPIAIPQTTLATDPVNVSASLTALLVATGIKVIPEPGSFILLALGLIGFVAVVRQRRG